MIARGRHGQAGKNRTTTYRSWHMMIQRCCNPNATRFERYGGRGITVCQGWRESFEAFYRDMGKRPEGTTLDRINRDGPYCKENCRWATRREQQSNLRSNRKISYQGETHTLAEWSRVLNLPMKRLESRLRKGWTVERAMREPFRPEATHCPNGHEYTQHTTHFYRGGRRCRICRSARIQRYEQRVNGAA